MARWIHTLDLTDLWEQASKREIYASQFARAVGERLEKLTLVSKTSSPMPKNTKPGTTMKQATTTR